MSDPNTSLTSPAAQKELYINFTAVLALVQAFSPHFISRGKTGKPAKLIFVTSGLGLIPAPNNSICSSLDLRRLLTYSDAASKAAMRSWLYAARIDFARYDVDIIELIPGLVESELHDEQGTTAPYRSKWMSLEEFTRQSMVGLQKGDPIVPIGPTVQTMARFQDGMLEAAKQRAALHEAVEAAATR